MADAVCPALAASSSATDDVRFYACCLCDARYAHDVRRRKRLTLRSQRSCVVLRPRLGPRVRSGARLRYKASCSRRSNRRCCRRLELGETTAIKNINTTL